MAMPNPIEIPKKEDFEEPKKPRINAKRKGAKNERHIADLFKKWTGYDFARTPSSGGLRWQRKNDTVGDIVCTDDKHVRRFPFSVEAKFHKDLEFRQLIGEQKSEVILFWEQAANDGLRVGRTPILMMRYNQMKKGVHYLAMPTHLYSDIKLTIKQFDPGGSHGLLIFSGRGHNFVIMDSRDLFSMPYEEIRLITKAYNKKNKI